MVLLLVSLIFFLWLADATCWLSRIKPFFNSYIDIFAGIGYFTVFWGAILTVLQIRSTSRQIKAKFSYQIHKDGRELMDSIEERIINVIESSLECECQPEEEVKAKRAIRKVLMFYSSVYHQFIFKNIDESEWMLLKEQFFSFLIKERVKKYWKNRIANNPLWHSGLRKLGNEYLKARGQ